MIICIAISVITALLLVGCSGTQGERDDGGTTPRESEDTVVVERDLAFEPKTVQVSVGDTITFENEDSEPHEVSIAGERLGIQQEGESVQWTAEEAGTFEYFCTIHPSMTGKVEVR